MATYYIAPTTHPTTPGNDTTGNGSSGSPWLTLTKANASSANGDTIILKAGTYTWSSIGHLSSIRTYQAETRLGAVIDGGGGNVSMNIGNALGNVFVTGVRFTNVDGGASGADVFSIFGTNTYYPTLQHCSFDNIRASGGVYMGNVFFNKSVPTRFSSCLFYKIDFYRSMTRPSLFENSGPYTSPLRLYNCAIVFNGTSTYKLTGVVGNGFGGNYITSINSIYYNIQAATVSWTLTGGSNFIANNNDFYNITSAPSGTGNITSDPLFVDAASGNFALRPTSPCLNTGTLV